MELTALSSERLPQAPNYPLWTRFRGSMAETLGVGSGGQGRLGCVLVSSVEGSAPYSGLGSGRPPVQCFGQTKQLYLLWCSTAGVERGLAWGPYVGPAGLACELIVTGLGNTIATQIESHKPSELITS